jgi:hypothetical protein
VIYEAEFGPGGSDSIYRYTLTRCWEDEPQLFPVELREHPQVCLAIMLNPSKADHKIDDPTVAKLIRLARAWGFGTLWVRNIFALRSPYPEDLRKIADPVGPGNDRAILEAVMDPRVGLIIAAWGNNGKYRNRSAEVRNLLRRAGKPVFAFKISGEGEPEHPLYQREDMRPEGMVRYL